MSAFSSSPLARSTSFKKGTPKPLKSGRGKGTRNKTTVMLKEATLIAAGACGVDGKGKGGLVGYLLSLAREHPPVFARLLEKVLPMQSSIERDVKHSLTRAQAAERLRERGLEVPSLL